MGNTEDDKKLTPPDPEVTNLADARKERAQDELAEITGGVSALALSAFEREEERNRLLGKILKNRIDDNPENPTQNVALVRPINEATLTDPDYIAEDEKIKRNAITITDEEKRCLKINQGGVGQHIARHRYAAYLRDSSGKLIMLYFNRKEGRITSYYAYA